MEFTREQAWQLLCEWTESESLRKHALAVEAGMRAYARRFGDDEELWAITGLIHDLDYEKHPDMDDEVNGHPRTALRLLCSQGWPEEVIHAVEGHAEFLGISRRTQMARALFAVDELTGLIMACAYVRPSKDIRDVTLQSVRKKWKDRRFAAGVAREDVERGAAELNVELNEHIGVVLAAMQGIAAELELDGSNAKD